MVGPSTIVKILHCRQIVARKKSSKSKDDDSNHKRYGGNSSTGITLKKERFDNETQVCRVCLQEGSVPIYGDDFFEDISEDLISVTAIDMSSDDDHPKYLCQSCLSLLQGAILLRKTARETEALLQQTDDNITYNHDEPLSDDTDDGVAYNFGFNVKQDDDVKYKYKRPTKLETCFHCKKCDTEFKTLEEYTEHRMSFEHEKKKTSCPVCGNMYTSAYIKKHLLYHQMDVSYMCDICGKKFVLEGQLNRHRETHFLEKLPYECSLCPYKGRFSEHLKMHMRTHTGEKPYQCPECPNRFFVNKSNLNRHLLTHKTDHNFKCTVQMCQRGFYTQRELDCHYKVDHSGIKEHLCNICGKAFGYRKQMMKHQLKVHKRDKLRSGRTPLYLLLENKKRAEEQNAV